MIIGGYYYLLVKMIENMPARMNVIISQLTLEGQVAIYFLLACCLTFASCSADQLEPPGACETMSPTYESNVKSIIDQTCAYGGCHDGAGGIGPGDYTSFAGLEQDINSGNFTERTINLRENPSRGMPPNNSTYPESQQDDMSAIQLEIIKCWIQNGFPE